jgi:amidophosphoribosyltransferase
VAYNRDHKTIASSINADDVVYLSLKDLEASCAELSPRVDQQFEVGVFCGRYVTPLPQGYLENLEKTRGKLKVPEKRHNDAFVAVGDSVTTRLMGYECMDVSLHNLISDLS